MKKALQHEGAWKLHYDIYGDGLLRSEVEELARLYPDQIIYHGYVTLSKVFEHSTDYDFVMMPSHFIETFGLSALDFAQFGIPTIGFQKGGLRQFVPDELDIFQSSGDTLQEKMNNLMERLVYECIHDDLAKYTIDKNTIKAKYGFPMWMEKFKNLL
jgi:glycosyltransferase involved in cell wall biosynthesis